MEETVHRRKVPTGDSNNSNEEARNHDLHTKQSLSVSEDFLCGCCFDLMVQPTTLTCGHSFCRLCIANWYLSSQKTECPQCRSEWTGNPQINITLKYNFAWNYTT